jgi:hypothetical protein
MEFKIGDTVVIVRNNIDDFDLVGKPGTVLDGPQGHELKYRISTYKYSLEGIWCDVEPLTKLHKLILGIE